MDHTFSRQSLLSLMLKSIVIVCACVGIAISALGTKNAFMGGSVVFMYFTTQSNILIAAICLAGGIYGFSGKPVGRFGQIMKFVGTISITLTGLVFCFVLAPAMWSTAWTLQSVLNHVVVPIASVVDFFVVGRSYDYRKKNSLWVTIPPLLYVIYAAIGYVCDWNFGHGYNYPYFFLNWGSPAGVFGVSSELPFLGTGLWIILLLVLLILISLLYLKIARVLGKKSA